MPQNPFDEAVLKLAEQEPDTLLPAGVAEPVGVNPFDAAVGRLKEEETARTRIVLQEASKTSPDRQAEINTLAERSGLDPDLVGRNFDQVSTEQAARDIPASSIQKDSPFLHESLADQNFATLVQDDIDNQGWIEWMLGGVGSLVGLGKGPLEAAEARGSSQIVAGRLTMKKRLGLELFTEQDAADLAEAKAIMETADPTDYYWWHDGMLATTQILPTIAGGAVQAAEFAAVGGAAGAVGGLAAGPGGAAAGAGAGAIIFGTAGMMGFSFELEGGLAIDEFDDFTDEFGNKIDPNVALGAGIAVGLVNAGVEVIQYRTLAKTFPPLFAALTAVRRVTTRAAARQALKSPTMRALFANVAARYLKTVALETGQEFVQEEVTLQGLEAAKRFSEADIAPMPPEEMRARREEAVVGAFAAMALLPMPGSMVRVGVGARNVTKATDARAFFQALGEAVPESKLFERAPAVLAGQMEKALKDGPLATVGLPTDTFETYWQSKGIDPAEIAEQLTGSSTAFEEARRTGVDLQVKTSAYATQLAATEHAAFFNNELRAKPGWMNGRDVDTIMERVAAAAETVATPEVAAIEADILAQLKEAKVPDPVGQASFVANFYAVMGERAGISPQELAEQYQLAITQTGQAFTQETALEATAAPLEQGPIQARVFHGTKSATETLTIQPEGTTDPGLVGRGLYFTPSREQAEAFARDPNVGAGTAPAVLEADLTLANPAVVQDGVLPDGRTLTDVHPEGITQESGAALQEELVAAGHDGVIFQIGDDITQYVAFNADAVAVAGAAVPLETPGGVGLGDQVLEPSTIQELLDRIQEGGFTYRVADGQFPAKGLSVSVAGGLGVKFHIRDLNARKVVDFIKLHAAALEDSGMHLGAWFNKKDQATGAGDDNVYLDISKVVTEEQEAQDLAVAEDQIAYFNLESFEEVVIDYPTGYQHGPNWQGEGGANAVEGGLPDSGVSGGARQDADRQGDVAGGAGDAAGGTGRGEPGAPDVELFQAPLPEIDPDQILVAPTDVVDGRWRNSSRVPTAVKREPSSVVLHTFLEALEASPNVHAKAATEFRNSRLVRPTALRNLNDKAAIRAAINTMKGNLKFLWDQMDPAVRARARAWYLGGHRLAGEFADEFGTTLAQMAGVIAVNSPQKDWNQNISLARRTVSLMQALDRKDANLPDSFDETLWAHYETTSQASREERAKKIRKESGDKAADDYLADKIADVAQDKIDFFGQRWEEMNLNGQARMLRAVDETLNEPGFDLYMPEGEPFARATNKDGTATKRSWGAYPTIVNALSILRDGSQPNIDGRIGFQHKVRSFYGNILDPTNPDLVTIDTHSVAASWLSPFGAKALAVKRTLGGTAKGSSKTITTGVTGFNAVIAQAHKELAAELSTPGDTVLPRELQSVTWEGVRSLWAPEERRSAKVTGPATELWNRYTTGKISLGRLHDALVETTDGFRPPDWRDSTPRVAADQIELRPSDVRARRPRVPARRGDRGRGAGRATRQDANQTAGPLPGQVFFQPGTPQDPRGRIRFGQHSVNIDLFKSADPSTLLHELGHFYFLVLTDIVANLPAERTPDQQQLAADLQTFREFVGAPDGAQVLTQAQQEMLAKAFEKYLREGKAPTVAQRSLFARFRVWLTDVYREVDELADVEINDDIRAVFDRLVATDQAIAAAQDEAGITPLITDPASVGMTPEAFAAYQDQVAAESLRAQEEVQARLIADLAREEQTFFKAARRRIRDAVEQEVHSRPVYQAFAAIRRGTRPDGTPLVEGQVTDPLLLDRDDIVEESSTGAEVLPALQRRFLFRLEGGVPVRLVSEQFGFDSPDALLQALATMEPQAAVIARETDARMEAEHPGLLSSPAELQEAAVEAIAGGAGREAIIRAELAALEAGIVTGTQTARGQITRRVLPQASVINEAARARIAGTVGREVRPGIYLQAAQRAGNRALQLLAQNQDRAAALDAKVQQLINMALYREALKARQLFDTRTRWVRDHNTTRARARIAQAGANYLQQWDQFLDDYDFAKVPLRDLDKRVSLKKFVEGLEANGLPVEMPEAVLEEANKGTNFQDMTVGEFREVTDAMQHLLQLGRLKNRLLRSEERRTLDELVGDIVTELINNSRGRRFAIPLEPSLPAEVKRREKQSFFAWGRKFASIIRQMDGGKENGIIWNALVRPGNERANAEIELRADATEKLSVPLDDYTTQELVDMNRPTVVPRAGVSLSRAGRIMVALNWGNVQNRQRVMDGFGWDATQVQAILDTLTEKDWVFVNTVWTQVNSYWPSIVAKQTRVFGYAPEKVEASPFQTKFGEQPGGYFPIKFDPLASPSVFANDIATTAKEMARGAATQATTRRGFTKARLEEVTGKRPRIDFSVFFLHINEVIHDVTHHEYLIDANRIIGHRGFREAVIEHYGEATYIELQNQMQAVAAGTIPLEHQGYNWYTRMVNGSAIAAMGHNLMTATVQFTGIFAGMHRVGPTWIARGFAEWGRSAVKMEAKIAEIHAESAFMKARPKTFNREVAEIQNKISPPGAEAARAVGAKIPGVAAQRASRSAFRVAQTLRVWQDSYFYFISRAQMAVDVVVYLGAREKAMQSGGVDTKTAIALAEQAVIDSQGSGLVKDLSQVQRDQHMKLFTQFMGYFNVIYNLGAENTAAWRRKQNPISFGRFAAGTLLLYTLPMVIEEASRDFLRGETADEDEDPPTIGQRGLEFTKDQLSYLFATVVGLRELGGALQGFRYSGPPALRLFSESINIILELVDVGEQYVDPETDEIETNWGRLLDAANQVGGIWYAYPAVTIERGYRTLYTIAEDPENLAAAWHVLFGGKPPPEDSGI